MSTIHRWRGRRFILYTRRLERQITFRTSIQPYNILIPSLKKRSPFPGYHRSSNPRHCKNSIPFSQLHRIRRLRSMERDFQRKAQEMCTFLEKRGYSRVPLPYGLQRVSRVSRRDAIQDPQLSYQRHTESSLGVDVQSIQLSTLTSWTTKETRISKWNLSTKLGFLKIQIWHGLTGKQIFCALLTHMLHEINVFFVSSHQTS